MTFFSWTRGAALLALLPLAATADITLTLNPDQGTFSVDGGPFVSSGAWKGVPLRGETGASAGTFVFSGDLVLDEEDVMDVVAGSQNPIHLVVGNDVRVAAGATISVAASGRTSRAGGGSGGASPVNGIVPPLGGAGGAGAAASGENLAVRFGSQGGAGATSFQVGGAAGSAGTTRAGDTALFFPNRGGDGQAGPQTGGPAAGLAGNAGTGAPGTAGAGGNAPLPTADGAYGGALAPAPWHNGFAPANGGSGGGFGTGGPGGDGGGGGLRGMHGTDGTAGRDGSDGPGGHAGGAGAGGSAAPAAFTLAGGGGGGRGAGGRPGRGGAGGSGGSSGKPGAGGGGGGGAGNWWSHFFVWMGSHGGDGGDGGNGGLGGAGGRGSDGGQGGFGGVGGSGGGGGGAIRIEARGQVVLDGLASARGGNGTAGTSGQNGQNGAAGAPGALGGSGQVGSPGGNTYYNGDPNIYRLGGSGGAPGTSGTSGQDNRGGSFGGGGGGGGGGGNGGSGGDGGRGGSGGRGGDGGAGGGGAGGTVWIEAALFSGNGTLDVRGGTSPAAAGATGRFLLATAGTTFSNSLGGITPLTAPAPEAVTPFIVGQSGSPRLVGLSGGAEAFGLWSGNPASHPWFLQNLGGGRSVRDGTRLLVIAGSTVAPGSFGIAGVPSQTFSDHRVVHLLALRPGLEQPRVVWRPLGDTTPPVSLQLGGWTRDPAITPNATGPSALVDLSEGEVYSFLVPLADGELAVEITDATGTYKAVTSVADLFAELGPDLTFSAWAANAGLSGASAQPMAEPHGDGVPNLLKFAFNLAPDRPDSRGLEPGGTAGLPSATPVIGAGAPGLRLESLRRKRAGLVYTLQTSEDLMDWTPHATTPPTSVTSLDADWERVVWELPATAPRFFVRMAVTH
jgi:hypothetical protein